MIPVRSAETMRIRIVRDLMMPRRFLGDRARPVRRHGEGPRSSSVMRPRSARVRQHAGRPGPLFPLVRHRRAPDPVAPAARDAGVRTLAPIHRRNIRRTSPRRPALLRDKVSPRDARGKVTRGAEAFDHRLDTPFDDRQPGSTFSSVTEIAHAHPGGVEHRIRDGRVGAAIAQLTHALESEGNMSTLRRRLPRP